MKTGQILIVAGTRPELIKLAPLYLELKKTRPNTKLCATFQHEELLDQALQVFNVVPDLVCKVMQPGQSLAELSSRLLVQITDHLEHLKPSCVIVQGDTSTAFIAGLAAFYQKIPVAHVEAGLRSFDMMAPFPEEMHRKVLGVLTAFHFAPNEKDRQALLGEGVSDTKIHCVGNTVVDALRVVLENIEAGQITISSFVTSLISQVRAKGNLLVIMTLHRREGFEQNLEGTCHQLGTFIRDHDNIMLVYPRHPNPATAAVSDWIRASGLQNRFKTIEAVAYSDMVYLMSHAAFIVTDSGGIQEEAVCLGIPVICVRDVTERTEGIDVGLVHLTGFDQHKFSTALETVLSSLDDNTGQHKPDFNCPYGDGFASEKIASILQKAL